MWLYPSDNWASDVANVDPYTSIPAYVNGHVYDFLGRSGPKDWYESRFAQPDVVLEDFLTIFYPGVHLSHQRAWWRNVFSEGETAALSASSCRDITEPFELKSDPCFEAPAGNLRNGECASSFDPNVDYFPSKITTQYPEYWTVEYFNNYKVALDRL